MKPARKTRILPYTVFTESPFQKFYKSGEMSRKVLLAFLGTGDYRTCAYKMPSGEIYETNFLLKALALSICSNWSENDRIFVFVTGESKRKNWDNRLNSDGKEVKGLNEILSELKLKVVHQEVEIPDVVSESKIWEIFEIMYNMLCDGDEIYVDITHGFRANPMLLMTLVNYSSFLKETTVKGIFYGAEQAAEELEGKKITPVWNLNDIALLNEWTSAALEYMNFGDSERIKKLAEKGALPGLKQGSKEEKNAALNVLNLSKALLKTSRNFATARGFAIYRSESIKETIHYTGEIRKENLIPPFSPFMNKIESKLKDFGSDNILNFLFAVRYCMQHGLLQQGITLLQEGIVSFILNEMGYKWCAKTKEEENEVKKNRTNTSNSLNILHNPNEMFKAIGSNGSEIYRKIKENETFNKLARIFSSLSQLRNDINHGGYVCPRKPEDFVCSLKSLYEETEKCLENYYERSKKSGK